ncbi:MAG: hypothetical protein HKN82_16235 [Akkermansiaceae bacterium]|nr:hypothetical protein [Akkermansiaceae bacterium]
MKNDPRLIVAAMFLPGLTATAPAGDQLSWKEVELVSATGVPGDSVHQYALRGVLVVVEVKGTKGFSLKKGGFFSKTSSRIKHALWVESSCSYDSRQKLAVERIKFEGDFPGSMVSEVRCNDDPWLNHNALGVVVKCAVNADGDRMLPLDSIVRATRLPLTVYGVDPARAAALSREAAARPGPPPPPPPPPPPAEITAVLGQLKQASSPATFGPIVPRLLRPLAAAPTIVEGESLAGAARASAGQASRQDMKPFGTGWSGNTQLFWNATQGAELTLRLDRPRAGTHRIAAYFTRAPDFGVVQLHLRQGGTLTPLGGRIDGYAPGVTRSPRVVLGVVTLAAGSNEIVVRVAAKSPKSSGHYFGLDCLELGPAPALQLHPDVRPGSSRLLPGKPEEAPRHPGTR